MRYILSVCPCVCTVPNVNSETEHKTKTVMKVGQLPPPPVTCPLSSAPRSSDPPGQEPPAGHLPPKSTAP